MKISHLMPVFVESFPNDPEEGLIFVSIRFRTAMHLCCCGCGSRIVTPIRPTDWSLSYNGVSVSLSPSIGNWSLPCRSHYWIKDGHVEAAATWSNERVEAARSFDQAQKRAFYESLQEPPPSQQSAEQSEHATKQDSSSRTKKSMLRRIVDFIFKRK